MPAQIRPRSRTLKRTLNHFRFSSIGIALLAIGSLSACAVGSAPPRPHVIPPISGADTPSPQRSTTCLANGLFLVHQPGPKGSIEAGLYFAGGSIDNPSDHTGLTSFLSHAGLTPSSAHNLNPMREALALGSTLKPTSDNTVFGWSLRGGEKDLEGMLALLMRIGTRDQWDQEQMLMLSRRSADQLTSLLDPGVQQALAVAVSSSLGLPTPKGLYGHADHVRRFTQEIVGGHWKRMVRPQRGTLVVVGGQAGDVQELATRLFRPWRAARVSGPTVPSCWPDRPASHLVVDPSATTRRIYTVVALRVPSPGDPGREAIEIALEAFGRVPGGRLSRVLGEARARDVSPHIVDLGWNNGEKGSVLLMRLSGPSRETLRALWDVIEAVHDVGARPPAGKELEQAWRHLQESRDSKHASPFNTLRELARTTLYGKNLHRASDFEAHVQAIFRRRNISIIGVGPNPLGPVLAELGTLTVWDSGGLILDGNNRPGCP